MAKTLQDEEILESTTLQQVVLETARKRKAAEALLALNVSASIKRNLEREDQEILDDTTQQQILLYGGSAIKTTGEVIDRTVDSGEDMNLSGLMDGASVGGDVKITVFEDSSNVEPKKPEVPVAPVVQNNITEQPPVVPPPLILKKTKRSGLLPTMLTVAGIALGGGGVGALGTALLWNWLTSKPTQEAPKEPTVIVKPVQDTDTIGVMGKDIEMVREQNP